MKRVYTPAISALRTARFTRFVVAPLTLIALFTGCSGWTTVWEPGAPSTSWDRITRIRVTYHAEATGHESTVLLDSATVFGDSLIGGIATGEHVNASRLARIRPQRLAIPLSDITGIEKRQTSAAPYIVGGILGAAAIVGLVFAFKSMDLGLDFSGMELGLTDSVAPTRP